MKFVSKKSFYDKKLKKSDLNEDLIENVACIRWVCYCYLRVFLGIPFHKAAFNRSIDPRINKGASCLLSIFTRESEI